MPETKFDVLAIGNAMVDVIVHAEEAFMAEQSLVRGAMTLIDSARAEALYAAMPAAIESSGGSAGNTIAGVASLGGRAAYIGKVSGDQLGDVFRHDIRAAGVTFDVPSAPGSATGRCLIFVHADADRTMQTFLGAGAELGPGDIDAAAVESAAVLYLEGYLWDPPAAKEAFLKAARIAHDAGRKVAITLSDPLCVERHRAEFVGLVEHHIDIVFANEAEITSLYECSFDEALKRAQSVCEIAALTRGAAGAVIVEGGRAHVVGAEPVEHVVDTTGAGDLYAAGYLYGYTHGMDAAACGRIGAIAAAEVISHFGARPEVSLAALVRERLG